VIAYIIRRLLYAIPILIGVNLLTFALFFFVNSPDDMARVHLGGKRVTPEAIEVERGPRLQQALAVQRWCRHEKLTDTILQTFAAPVCAQFIPDNGAISVRHRQRMWRVSPRRFFWSAFWWISRCHALPFTRTISTPRAWCCASSCVRLHVVLRHGGQYLVSMVAAPGAGLGL
jgi:hypothetical protein